MGNARRRIGAVVFDFNGTMIFDAPVNRASWRKMLIDTIGMDCTDEEFVKQIQGVNANESLVWFFENKLGRRPEPEELARLAVEADACYQRTLLEHEEYFHLASGLERFLDLLADEGIALNIATAAPKPNVDLFFEHLGLSRWFSRERVALNDGSLPGKPAPDIYLLGADRIGVPIGSCAVFEDAGPGIEAARRAGAACIVGVASGLDPHEMATLPGVDFVIRDFEEHEDIARRIGAVGV